jgi:hypothetical protein
MKGPHEDCCSCPPRSLGSGGATPYERSLFDQVLYGQFQLST